MKSNEPQKSLFCFLLNEDGGELIAKLSPAPVVPVLLALTSVCNGDMVVKCSQTTLAKNLGMHRGTLRRAVKALESAGLIVKRGRSVYLVLSVNEMRQTVHHASFNAQTVHHAAFEASNGAPCIIQQQTVHHAAFEKPESGNDTFVNILPLRGSSSARTGARIATPPTEQEKIVRLENIIVEKLGRQVWDRSTNWAELYNRANRDIELIEDAVIAYQEKVIQAGQNHSFTRLLNFVKRERISREKQEQKANPTRPAYRPAELHGHAAKATQDELERLSRFLDGS